MDHLVNLINSYLPEPHASLLNGMVLGRQLFVTDTFYEQLKIVGLIHLVVLSGSNISMLSAIILNLIVKWVGHRAAIVVTILCITLFIWFVGAEPPVVRAGIMGMLSLVGLLFGRKTLAIYILFLSSVLMILVNHEWLTSISFQLSVAATLGIILFGKVETVILSNAKDPEDKKSDGFFAPLRMTHTFKSYFYEELRISVAAQIFTLPVIFYYFRTISLVAPVANVIISWLVAPIIVLGLLILAVGSVWWEAGFVLSWIAYGMIQMIIWVVEILARVPYAQIKLL